MKKAAVAAGAGIALAGLGWWWAAKLSPPTVVSGSAAKNQGPSPETLAKLKTLGEILRSRNDNDPRLDSDFNDLSPETRQAFRQAYRRMAPELRNERGTIVYLLGRGSNLSSGEDWSFLREVAAEPPCFSLADCSKPAASTQPDEQSDEITLAYPSLVALKLAEQTLQKESAAGGVRKDSIGFQGARQVVQAAKGSKTRVVARAAEKIERKFLQ